KGVEMAIGKTPLVLGPGVKTGLNIKLDNPAELGADLCATAVGALSQYELPCIIVDLGTATKITILGENGDFLGGAIAPGLLISLDALAGGASMLSSIALKSPKASIGTNTPECIRSGMVYGTADMIDGTIERMMKEVGAPVKTIVATGGLSPVVIKHCSHSIIVNKNLLMEGLKCIYEKNN
ncbi:MAG: type III pantothenate kinase, partial [Clostridia bacterium]|nr:type III pantothenate kinase [Clostridia bacterium]